MNLRTLIPLIAAITACVPSPDGEERIPAPPVQIGEADGVDGVEVVGWLRPDAPVTGNIESTRARLGFVFHASDNARVDVEVTHQGSSRGLDTLLAVYGPRHPDGVYEATVATDDASGYGELSRLRGLELPAEGFYIAEVSVDRSTMTSDDLPMHYRLALDCDPGACGGFSPVTPAGLDIRWVGSSAEYLAGMTQAYGQASRVLEARSDAGSLPAAWAVALDIDETVLSNARYQRERTELGVGYSYKSWTAWVARREATPMPGAVAFLSRIQALGGSVALVTNRRTGECADTEANLVEAGVPFDLLLCRTDVKDKGPRWAMVEDGTAPGSHQPAEIVMYVGDNIEDFPGLSQEVRNEGPEALADFGERFIVLPNPMYGSWEDNED